ncbi:uncharacterized protein LOC117782603 [Drosophila innubila]|uniref:uncharacterized protein LOC117782603 n=1 Tax=Drosophila innubila TaxID=198719 RepID=UPI00148DF50A|nr:uncharacterized protein LOC117782603 [Drosophila innubila]
MKTRKLYNYLPWCLLLILLMVYESHCRRQPKTKAQSKRLQTFSPAELLKEYNASVSSAEQLDDNIMSWTGVRIQERKQTTPSKTQNPRRRKTKSGLLIESNIAEDQQPSASAEIRSGKKYAQQRRRNGRIQRPNIKSNANSKLMPL